MIANAINIVLAILVMLAVGMLLFRLKWLNNANLPLISKLVVKIALPAMIVSNMFANFDQAGLRDAAKGLAAPYLSILICIPVALLLARLVRIPSNKRGVFTTMFLFSNSVFIGVPVSVALFGEGAMPYTLMYYIANTSLFWSLGVFMMGRDAGEGAPKGDLRALPAYLAGAAKRSIAKDDPKWDGAKLTLAKIKRMFPLPMLFLIGVIPFIALGVRLPAFLATAAKYVGSMVTPLSLIYTGAVIMRMIIARRIKWQKGYLSVLLGRFALAPALMIGLCALFGLPAIMKNALIMQAAMPVMASTPIVAGDLGADEEYAAGGMALSTFLSLAVIPFYMMLF